LITGKQNAELNLVFLKFVCDIFAAEVEELVDIQLALKKNCGNTDCSFSRSVASMSASNKGEIIAFSGF